MRKSNIGLRAVMAAASIAAFLGGWVMFGHAPNPATAANNSTVTTNLSSGASQSRFGQGSSGLFQIPQARRARLPACGSARADRKDLANHGEI